MGDCRFRLKIRQIEGGCIQSLSMTRPEPLAEGSRRVIAGLSGTVAVRSGNLLLFFEAPERDCGSQTGSKPLENRRGDGWHGTCISEQRTWCMYSTP